METNYAEEQATELESLESIYPDSFEKDADEPLRKFRMKIVPHPDTDEPNHVGVVLHVRYPERYPDEPPHLELEKDKGLTVPQMKEITELAVTTARENEGLACMFQVISELQEYLVTNNIPGDTSFHDQMRAQKELDARLKRLQFGSEEKTDDHSALDVHSIQDFDKSYRRKRGTPVTKDSFNEWNKTFLVKYREDMRILREQMYGNDANREQLTGKQIFEAMAKEQLGQMAHNNDDANDDDDDEDDEDADEEDDANDTNEMKENEVNGKDKKKKRKKKKNKTIVVGDKENNEQDDDAQDNTVYVDDASLFLMDMPDA